MPTILLARHAQASFGQANYDVLSTLGRRQAAALGRDLMRRDLQPHPVVTGSLVRQRDTVGEIAAQAGAGVTCDSRWDEYDTNEILERHSTSAARVDRPAGSDAPAVSSRSFQVLLEAALLEWIEAGPGSPAVESWPAFSARVEEALAELAAGQRPGTTALVCTSAGVIAAVCVALLAVPASRLIDFNRVVVNASLTKLVHGRAGTTLVSFNEHAHLEHEGRSLITYR